METEVEETTGQKHKTICAAVGVTVTSGADFVNGLNSLWANRPVEELRRYLEMAESRREQGMKCRKTELHSAMWCLVPRWGHGGLKLIKNLNGPLPVPFPAGHTPQLEAGVAMLSSWEYFVAMLMGAAARRWLCRSLGLNFVCPCTPAKLRRDVRQHIAFTCFLQTVGCPPQIPFRREMCSALFQISCSRLPSHSSELARQQQLQSSQEMLQRKSEQVVTRKIV